MVPDESPKRSSWAYIVMAAASVGLLVAFGLCAAGFRNGFDQGYVNASVLLFVISATAMVIAVIAAITGAFK
jgi:hypothetical protein